MMRAALCGTIALAGLVAACYCPSLWLTVTRRAPGPRPALPLPAVAEVPIPDPPQYDNRFDILGEAGNRMPASARRFDDRASTAAGLTRSLEGLSAMKQALGLRSDPEGSPSGALIPGTLAACVRKICTAIAFPASVGAVAGARLVHVRRRDTAATYVIQACEPDVKSGQQIRCDETPELCGEPGVCKAYPPGTQVIVTEPIPCGACTDEDKQVRVAFSREVERPPTALTFVHLSDVQLRDGDVTLDDPELSRRLDWVVQSFEYDPDEMFFGRYMVEAMLATINDAAAGAGRDDPARPSFVIHTGDLIDAGVSSEVELVHGMIDQLAIPWFDVIGNHDVLVFGNLLPSAQVPRAALDDGCVSAGSVIAPYFGYFRSHRPHWLPTRLCAEAARDVTLVAAGTHAESLKRFISYMGHDDYAAIPQVVDRVADVRCPGDRDIGPHPLTRNHGFDLNHDRGYYAFLRSLTLGGAPRRALFIVLDSMDLLDGEGGNVGRVREPQFRWLQHALQCADPKDLIFLFAHHGISEILVGDRLAPTRPARSRLEDLLVAHNQQHHNIIGFLFGHHHVHEICKDPRPTVCTSFWEVQTASIVDLPQEGRLIRIKDAGHGLAFLELTAFGPHLANRDDAFSRAVAIAHHGAERDYCRTAPNARCSETLEPYRSDGRDTFARLFFVLPEYPPPR